MKECISHHHACDCREATFKALTVLLREAMGINPLGPAWDYRARTLLEKVDGTSPSPILAKKD